MPDTLDPQVYYKKGRRYISFKPFRGFHADGIWIVKDDGRHNALFLRLPEYPIEDIKRYARNIKLAEIVKDVVMNYITDNSKEYKSAIKVSNDIAELIMEKINA